MLVFRFRAGFARYYGGNSRLEAPDGQTYRLPTFPCAPTFPTSVVLSFARIVASCLKVETKSVKSTTFSSLCLSLRLQTERYEKDLLATTGDYLRLWNITDHSCELEQVLNNNKSSEFCAPLTSFDWCEVSRRHLCTTARPQFNASTTVAAHKFTVLCCLTKVSVLLLLLGVILFRMIDRPSAYAGIGLHPTTSFAPVFFSWPSCCPVLI
jgi:hypothetical protein